VSAKQREACQREHDDAEQLAAASAHRGRRVPRLASPGAGTRPGHGLHRPGSGSGCIILRRSSPCAGHPGIRASANISGITLFSLAAVIALWLLAIQDNLFRGPAQVSPAAIEQAIGLLRS